MRVEAVSNAAMSGRVAGIPTTIPREELPVDDVDLDVEVSLDSCLMMLEKGWRFVCRMLSHSPRAATRSSLALRLHPCTLAAVPGEKVPGSKNPGQPRGCGCPPPAAHRVSGARPHQRLYSRHPGGRRGCGVGLIASTTLRLTLPNLNNKHIVQQYLAPAFAVADWRPGDLRGAPEHEPRLHPGHPGHQRDWPAPHLLHVQGLCPRSHGAPGAAGGGFFCVRYFNRPFSINAPDPTP